MFDWWYNLLEYLKEHDVKGIVEWLAEWCSGSDIKKVKAVGTVATGVIVILLIDYGIDFIRKKNVTVIECPEKDDDCNKRKHK